MQSVIPFEKELEFGTKVSEILSISLEREYEVLEDKITGNLLVTGDYKSHEVSANTLPFSFKIPFTIELSSSIQKDTVSLEICDFSYDMKESNSIIVHIELELNAEEEVVEEPVVSVDPNEIIDMLEHPNEKLERDDEEINDDEVKEELDIKEKDMEETEEQNFYTTYHVHIVTNSETLETICASYHINPSLLGEFNDINNLKPGMKLIIPQNDES